MLEPPLHADGLWSDRSSCGVATRLIGDAPIGKVGIEMKGAMLGLVVGLCVVSTTVGSAQNAWAACQQVYEHDFIGSRCENASWDRMYISFSGTFSDAAGGTMTGFERTSHPLIEDGTYASYKEGTLRTGNFVGTMNRDERRTRTVGALATTVTETRRGKHRLDDGGVLEPNANGVLGSSTSRLVDHVGSGYTFTMEGQVTSPTFRGTRLHEERQDTGSSTCNTYLRIEQTGEWTVPGAGRFTGTLTTEKSCTTTGTPTTQVIDNRVKFNP